MRRLCNDNWSFAKFKPETEPEMMFAVLRGQGAGKKKEVVLKQPGKVDIPHDWQIENTLSLYESSIGAYRKILSLDGQKHNLLYFEGVYMNTTVYLNGVKLLFWPYGYSSFEVDLTSAQKDGENELIVTVDYREPNTRWYSGAGIFRDVWFFEKESVRLVTDGIYVSTQESANGYRVIVDTQAIADAGSEGQTVTVKHVILDANRTVCAQSEEDILVYRESNLSTQKMEIVRPRLWDLENPYLYELTTQLFVGGEMVDEVTQKIGLRKIYFDPNEGFLLNDKKIKIHGACMHHDLGSLGSAFHRAALERQFRELKKMGINSVRTSHNMPAKALMEVADEMGMLIDTESFDMWEACKTSNDYGVYFHDYCERDVESWVRRDRNHPSLIMWSIGNEIPDTNQPGAEQIAIRLRDAVRRNDYRHNAYTTIASNYVSWEPAQNCSDKVEVSGYNYLENLYEEHHNEKYPHWCIYGSETSSTVQSRGIYHFPKSNRLLTYEDMQCSCLDNCSTNWGAKSVHKTITDDRDAAYCIGQYIWTGWDYIGEPTPYFSKNSFFGHIDTAGFWKDTAYIFKAGWVDYRKDAFVHLSPYWDFNPGQLIDVNVFSNAPKVALFLNDVLIGEKELDQQKDLFFSATWQLPYKEGVLRAVAYDENGKVLAEETKQSFTDPVALVLGKEKENFVANGEDLMFVAISAADKNGTKVANARNRVVVDVEGPGRLVGLDNGDSTDYDQYKTNCRKLFSGKLMAIIAATKEAGTIRVKVSSEGLESAELSFEAIPGEAREGISCDYRVQDYRNDSSVDAKEVPIRKIVLTCDKDRKMNADNHEVYVKAKIYPNNATHRDITFKASTLEGISSSAVTIVPDADGLGAKLVAVGDGEFRLICSAANGKDHTEVMSELEFEVTGLGLANLDPYDMVHGCQFAESDKSALLSFRGSVNLSENHTTISFANIDFGEYGSDELVFSIFSFRDAEPVEIWDGKPEESELLFKGTYEMKSIYNVFQENTFVLSKRLKGVRGLTFRFENGFVFGGFSMAFKEKAYGYLNATEYQMITGDSYEEREDGIYAIGNNVDLEFQHMNFTEGISAIEITGRAHIPSNPVHVRFFGDQGDSKQICEFEGTDDIVTKTFPLESVTGLHKVSIMFMPGSNFDLIGFKFIK